MPTDLLQIVESTTLDMETISSRTAQIHANVLSKSKYLHIPNFTRIHPDDLALLFAEYDGKFFGGQVKETLGATPLHFRLSKRMTTSGGKTARYTDRSTGRVWYDISASATMLFGCAAPRFAGPE